MKTQYFQSLRFRIFFIAFIATIPLIVLSVYNASEARNREREDLKDEAVQLVNFTLVEEAQTIDATRQVLLSLSNLPKEYLFDSVRCSRYLSDLLTKYQRYVNLGIVNNKGILFASGRPDEITKDYSKSEFFDEVMEEQEFSVGEYFVDPINHKRIINLGYRLLDENKKVKAVLFASLDVSYIDVIEKDLAKIFHEKSLFIKIDNEGDILATNTSTNEQIESIFNPSFLANISKEENGIIETPGPGNHKYLFVYATTKSNLFQQKLHLIVGVNKESFFSEINKALYRNLFLIGILFIAILVGIMFFTEKYILTAVKKLIAATEEMSTGNLQIRSHVNYTSGELGQLALAFDRMVESLDRQTREREFVEKHLHLVLNNAPITIFAIDKNGFFTLSEGKGLQRVGLKPGENVGVSAVELYKTLKVIESNGNITTGEDVIARVLNGESMRGITELRGVYFDNQFVPMFNSNKNIIGLIGVAIDITEKQLAENLLKESEERFHNLFEYSPISLWWEDFSEIKKHVDKLRVSGIQDFRTYFNQNLEELASCVRMLRVVDVNNATLEMYQAKSKDELLQGLSRLFNEESYVIFTEELIALIEGKTSFECEANTLTRIGKKNDVILKLLILPGCEDTWSKVLVSIIDITERKKSEEEKNRLFIEVQKAETQLRILSRRLLETQEAERKKISRELHDEIGQTLTAAKINLQSIQRITKSSKILKDLNVTISYLEQSLQQVRDISLNLRPSILDDLGIEAALRWLINRFTQNTKIKFDLQYSCGNRILPKDLQLECYRISQEALNNIIKYAHAKKVIISLTIIDELLHLKINDDGKGFDVQQAKEQALKGKSLGILSMEERVKLAGGEFNLTSSTINGTVLLAIFHLA